MLLEHWELLSYVVTVFGLPLAIYVFLFEQRKERENEEEAVYMQLSDNYQDFLRVALDHHDLQLFLAERTPDMSPRQARRWSSWEDYMREWLRRADFRESLPQLLRGEDPAFVAMLEALAPEDA